MQSITKVLWGTGFAATSLGLLLTTLQAEPDEAALQRRSGVVDSVAAMKTGHRLVIGSDSFGFQLRGNQCEDAARILRLKGQEATFLYVPTAILPAQEPPYWPLYAVYQGGRPLCSYAAARRNAEREKTLTRYMALGAGLLALPFFAGLLRRRRSPATPPSAP